MLFPFGDSTPAACVNLTRRPTSPGWSQPQRNVRASMALALGLIVLINECHRFIWRLSPTFAGRSGSGVKSAARISNMMKARSFWSPTSGGIMIILAAWLTKKINSPKLAAFLGLVLICVAIYGKVNNDMPTILAVIIVIIGVINMLRLIPEPREAAADEHAPD